MPDSGTSRIAVRIEPWGADDLWLERKLMGDPAMTTYLGGPEGEEKIAARHARFLDLPVSGKGQMFKIVDAATGEAVGGVGYWESEWRGEPVYEMGWGVLVPFQGQGVARAATAQAIEAARSDGKQRFLHAFPLVENAPSNGVCRTLGFTLVEECDGEYPPGNPVRCNDWRLDLFANDQATQ
jgi:RimJ/RimL family protein N-acetyltransferase